MYCEYSSLKLFLLAGFYFGMHANLTDKNKPVKENRTLTILSLTSIKEILI